MLDEFAGASETLTEVASVLKQPASFSMEPLQTMLDLFMFTFPAEELLKDEKN